MTERVATCRCGALQVTCRGEPIRVSVCHCLDCQRRSGSAFAAQARWPHDRVRTVGRFAEWSPPGNGGGAATFRFCPTCGSTVTYVSGGLPDLTAVAIGAFGDPTFPPPHYSVFEARRHRWVAIDGEIEHFA